MNRQLVLINSEQCAATTRPLPSRGESLPTRQQQVSRRGAAAARAALRDATRRAAERDQARRQARNDALIAAATTPSLPGITRHGHAPSAPGHNPAA